jgi:hypothetical protein
MESVRDAFASGALNHRRDTVMAAGTVILGGRLRHRSGSLRKSTGRQGGSSVRSRTAEARRK